MAQRGDISRNQAATLIANGNVTVNGRREKASYRPVAGDVVLVEEPVVVTREIVGESIPLSIAWEDDVSGCDRQAAGDGRASGTGELVRNAGACAARAEAPMWRPERTADRAGIIHRLDKETSGLLIVAKTERAHRILSARARGAKDTPQVRGDDLGSPRGGHPYGRETHRA